MNLLKSLAAVSSITAFSRILGFARDSIIAMVFGIGMTTDAFFIAFKLPNLLRRIFAEGAFSQVFGPILTEYKRKQDKNIIQDFIAHISGFLILVLIFVISIGILIAPWTVMIIAPGFSNSSYEFRLTTKLLRIIFPYIFLISLTSMMGTVLNIWNMFLVPAFAPILLNIAMIVFSLFVAPHFEPPVLALAWSVMVGGVFQLAYQLLFLKKIDMLVFPKINLHHSGAIWVAHQMGPAILSVFISHVSIIINTIFASFLSSGSISWIYYADRLMEFPSGVLGVALGTILLSSLSKSFTDSNYDEYRDVMDWGLRLCFLLTLPSTVALEILARPLIVSLFQYGKFTEFDVLMTQHALIAHSVGLIGVILVKVLISGFYSRHDIKTPVKISIITLIITQLMNLIFIGPLKHAGLSLSIGISSCLNAAHLYWKLRKQKIFVPKPGWIDFFLRLLISVFVMAIVLIGILYVMPDWSSGTMSYRLIRLIIVVAVGGVTYFLMLSILGLRIRHFKKYIA